MSEEQVKKLNLGIEPLNARNLLMIESAFNWINDNTSLTVDFTDESTLTANVKLFVVSYVDIMSLPVGVSSQSIEGLSQSFDTFNRTNLLWQRASEIFGDSAMSQMSFVSAKKRWSTCR